MTKIEVFDEHGALIASMETSSYKAGKRMSVWAGIAQRKLDKLIAANPGAVTGAIGRSKFTVRNGRSQAI